MVFLDVYPVDFGIRNSSYKFIPRDCEFAAIFAIHCYNGNVQELPHTIHAMIAEYTKLQDTPRALTCISDWDGTLRPGFMLIDWVHYLSKQTHVSSSFYEELLSLRSSCERKEITYESFAVRALDLYGHAMHGLRYDEMLDVAREFVSDDFSTLFPFTKPLLTTLRDSGYRILIISGAPLIPLQAYAKCLPIDHIFGVDVERKLDGTFGSKIIKNYALISNKRRIIDRLKKKGYSVTVGIGDTDSDRPLLDAARYPFFVSAGVATKQQSKYAVVTPDTIFQEIKKIIL